MTDSKIDIESSLAVSILGTRDHPADEPPLSSVDFHNSTVAALYLVHSLARSDAHRQRFEMRADGLKFSGKRLFKQNPKAPIPDLDFLLENSELSLKNSILWLQTDDVSTVLARLSIRSNNTVFPTRNSGVQIGMHGNPIYAKKFAPLSEFDPTTGIYNGRDATGTSIVIKETGERFADLATAAAAAMPGATLQLRGHLAANRLIISSAKPINLEAAPGARPTISPTNPKHHGIYLSGPCTVRGIRFESAYGDQDAWLPVIGINGRGHEVLVEQCEFITTPRESRKVGGHTGLGISDTPNAIVRDCIFRTPRSAALQVGTRCDNLLLTDCSFVARTVFDRRNVTAPSARSLVRLERCAVLSDYFLKRPRTTRRFDPLDFQIEECLLDVRTTLFELADVTASELPELVSWKGKNNIHRSEVRILQTFEANAGADFVPVEADDFAALTELGVSVENTGANYEKLFDYARLRAPITPSALLKSLDPSIKSPAINTLEKLKKSATDSNR